MAAIEDAEVFKEVRSQQESEQVSEWEWLSEYLKLTRNHNGHLRAVQQVEQMTEYDTMSIEMG